MSGDQTAHIRSVSDIWCQLATVDRAHSALREERRHTPGDESWLISARSKWAGAALYVAHV